MTTTESLAARRDRALGAGAPLFYAQPLEIVRGDGVYLFDADGRRYVDMYNNVPCVGHANPHVVEAMRRQQATLNTMSATATTTNRISGCSNHAVRAITTTAIGITSKSA